MTWHAPAGQGGDDWLRRYLQDHHVASRGGLELFQRSARSQTDPAVRLELARLTAEVAEDRASLLALLDELGVPRSPVRENLVVLGGRVRRLRGNGRPRRRSPLSDVVELEALSAAVHAKELGCIALRAAADRDSRLNPYQLDELVHRARNQQARLEELRLEAADRVFTRPSGGAPQ